MFPTFYMPAKVFVGKINDYGQELIFGKRALIVTGQSSKINGSLDDVLNILNNNGVESFVFDKTEENPSIENVVNAAEMFCDNDIDYVIGVGGGSPLDAAKAISVLLANPGMKGSELYQGENAAYLPVLAIPTTAGTGSEITPYSILTIHDKQTKGSINHMVYPEKAFLCAEYTMSMPHSVTLSTAVDALTHLIEGFLSGKANIISDRIAEIGIRMFVETLGFLKSLASNSDIVFDRDFELSVREKLLVVSAMGGAVITQTKTSLPHFLGYALTYFNQYPHGFANGILIPAFLEFHEDKARVAKIYEIFGGKDEFCAVMSELITKKPAVTEQELLFYSREAMKNPSKLKTHPYPVCFEDINGIYSSILF